ncbi:hypothetical protein C2G38_2068074 [Gigaspora rosea]|uniref:Uncharacterized protein n=1 Tax=Gigaspora rosea TaxID=44941 RepID=A0A397VW25_9GLOM|nr:hypothetical protein C2G38_2068074 [Gigaspora rosea]
MYTFTTDFITYPTNFHISCKYRNNAKLLKIQKVGIAKKLQTEQYSNRHPNVCVNKFWIVTGCL